MGCIVGCLIEGRLSDRYGRKPGLMLSALIFAISSCGMAFSASLSVFIIMRFAAGIGVGMASMLSLEQFVKGFGQDVNGEIYVAISKQLGPTGDTGKIYKLVAEKEMNH